MSPIERDDWSLVRRGIPEQKEWLPFLITDGTDYDVAYWLRERALWESATTGGAPDIEPVWYVQIVGEPYFA